MRIISSMRALGAVSKTACMHALLYVQLAETIFKETTDEFTVRVAKSLDEVCRLLKVGFEYVTYMDNVKLFRKRK